MYNLFRVYRITAGTIDTGSTIAFWIIALFCFFILFHNNTKLIRNASQDKMILYELMKELYEQFRVQKRFTVQSSLVRTED